MLIPQVSVSTTCTGTRTLRGGFRAASTVADWRLDTCTDTIERAPDAASSLYVQKNAPGSGGIVATGTFERMAETRSGTGMRDSSSVWSPIRTWICTTSMPSSISQLRRETGRGVSHDSYSPVHVSAALDPRMG